MDVVNKTFIYYLLYLSIHKMTHSYEVFIYLFIFFISLCHIVNTGSQIIYRGGLCFLFARIYCLV